MRLRPASPGAAAASGVRGAGARDAAPPTDPDAPAAPPARLCEEDAPPCAPADGDPAAGAGDTTISTCPCRTQSEVKQRHASHPSLAASTMCTRMGTYKRAPYIERERERESARERELERERRGREKKERETKRMNA